MFQMGLRSQPDEQPLSDYSDDLKETIEQTNELNEVDDDGSVQGSRGLQSGSGDSIFGTDHEDKVRMQLPLDWVEERFRVDRRKLEEMILGEFSHFLWFSIAASFSRVNGRLKV
jgi:hypothetical protein